MLSCQHKSEGDHKSIDKNWCLMQPKTINRIYSLGENAVSIIWCFASHWPTEFSVKVWRLKCIYVQRLSLRIMCQLSQFYGTNLSVKCWLCWVLTFWESVFNKRREAVKNTTICPNFRNIISILKPFSVFSTFFKASFTFRHY